MTMAGSFPLGRIFGIPLRLHYSWFIIFALVTISLSLSYLPHNYPLWERIVGAAITSILFFAGVVAHELSHSLVARRQGIPVKDITLFVFGGVAQITKEASHPGAELLMAIAGPLSSVVIGGIFFGLGHLAQWGNHLAAARLLVWLAEINLLLALFNLIPGFPLDGGRVLRAILWKTLRSYRRATRIASLAGRGIAYLFIIGGIVMIFTVDPFSGLWFAFIGWFLENAASTSYRQAESRSILQGFTAREVMSANYPAISPTITLGELVQNYILPLGQRSFLVVEEERLRGIITFSDIKTIAQSRWGITRVEEAMTPVQKLVTVQPEDNAATILEYMEQHDIKQVPVVKEGKALGVVTRDNLLHFIRIRSELRV